jgi:curli biogenesis system outer membrane secretion channel CsgG
MRIMSFILAGAAVCAVCLNGCASMPGPTGPRAVAVWNLEDVSPEASSQPDLGQVLSGEILQTIKERADVRVVEREKLVAIMEELKLGSSDLADDSTRLRVGRMIGAAEMVFGGYMVVGGTMRIDLRRVDVETGKVVKTAKKTAGSNDITGWIKASQDAAAELYSK